MQNEIEFRGSGCCKIILSPEDPDAAKFYKRIQMLQNDKESRVSGSFKIIQSPENPDAAKLYKIQKIWMLQNNIESN